MKTLLNLKIALYKIEYCVLSDTDIRQFPSKSRGVIKSNFLKLNCSLEKCLKSECSKKTKCLFPHLFYAEQNAETKMPLNIPRPVWFKFSDYFKEHFMYNDLFSITLGITSEKALQDCIRLFASMSEYKNCRTSDRSTFKIKPIRITDITDKSDTQIIYDSDLKFIQSAECKLHALNQLISTDEKNSNLKYY